VINLATSRLEGRRIRDRDDIAAWRPDLRITMSTLLAWRNLVHDRSRLILAVLGVAFAVQLMAIQLSLLLGFAQTASGIIDHSGADLWIAGRGTRNVDQSAEMPARRKFEAMGVPGVMSADKYIVQFNILRRPDGGTEYIILVGYNLNDGIGGPWNLVAGSVEDLKLPGSIIVDDLYSERLGITHVGQIVEINNHRTRVVGITHGIRTFAQSPYIFTSFETAQKIRAAAAPDTTNYILIRNQPGADRDAVKRALAEKMPGADVLTGTEFGRATQIYWLFSTGAGLDLILAAFLGVVIGVVITAQTLYASAVDHLPEYATLRAMGATDRYLTWVIVKQAVVNAAAGYIIGAGAALVIVHFFGQGVAAMWLPWHLVAGLGVVTVVMCVGSGIMAIRRVVTVNPTSVFR
jgi:putative ABC transport system permease protein